MSPPAGRLPPGASRLPGQWTDPRGGGSVGADCWQSVAPGREGGLGGGEGRGEMEGGEGGMRGGEGRGEREGGEGRLLLGLLPSLHGHAQVPPDAPPLPHLARPRGHD